MSAEVLVVTGTDAPDDRVVPSLAVQEGWRLLRHPLILAGFALFLLVAGKELFDSGGAREAFALVDSAVTYFPGVLAVLAANLLATRDLRAGAGETLAALPARQYERTKALCLASFVPAAVAAVAVLSAHAAFLAVDRYPQSPNIWHLLEGPVTVLGACLFGIMVARWLPYRGAPVVALVALIAFNVWAAGDAGHAPLGPMMSWPGWGTTSWDWVGLVPGSAAWHVLYLAGLCGLAATAALLRDAPQRLPVVAGGILAAALTLTAGLAQLP